MCDFLASLCNVSLVFGGTYGYKEAALLPVLASLDQFSIISLIFEVFLVPCFQITFNTCSVQYRFLQQSVHSSVLS